MAEDKTGVYSITQIATGRRYVGSAARSLRERWNKHRHYLRRGCHHNIFLQRAWVKYGESAFEFSVLEECAPDKCVEREQYWIDALDSVASGFNHCPIAGSVLGTKATSETRAKQSAIAKARTFSEETRRKFSDNMKAKWANDAERKRISASIKAGKTPESYANQAAKVRGRKHTPEAIAKIAAASRAVTPEKRAENAAKIRASGVYKRQGDKLRGRKFSPETCANMSAALKGIPKSPEHRAKLAARTAEWHKRKARQKKVDAWFETHIGMRPDQIDWTVAA